MFELLDQTIGPLNTLISYQNKQQLVPCYRTKELRYSDILAHKKNNNSLENNT
jgi:hypothetical protein